MDRALRIQVRVALDIHREGRQAAALECATLLAGANPGSALALNLLGYLHVLAGGAALSERAAVDDETSSHFRAAHDAFSAAAGNAPNCVLTTVSLARALASEDRYAEAQRELLRVISMAPSDQADPAVNNVGYKDDVDDEDSSPKEMKDQALRGACDLVKEVSDIINKEIVPREAGKLLGVGGDAAHLAQTRERARLLSRTYQHSAGARLLRVCIELERVRDPDAALDRRRLHLHRRLDLISDAAGIFDSSHLLALFHAKILFALDKFDESEKECRRALRIDTPSDPNLDDIPPFVSVPGADYDFRVSAVKKQIRILLKRIIVVAGVCWSSIKSTQHGERVDRVISVRVDTLQEHYKGIDKPAADAISDTLRFFKKHGSWSFLVCPNSSCHREKFPHPESLWKHIRSKHRDDLLKKLQSVLGELLYEKTAMDDHSFDGMITLTQDSKQHDIFHLPRLQPMFESLLLSPSVGIQAEPLAEMRQRKCTEGAVVFDDTIRKKLRMLPKNEASIQFQELSFEIQNLWLNFLETSALDPREIILPLARSFQWIEMKKSIALSLKDLSGIIRGANIDSIFGTSGQSVKEMASTSSCQQSLIVSNKNNADKGLSILSIAIRSLCNLRHFRDRFLTQPLVWIPSADNICIAQQFYEIFTSWEKNDHQLTGVVLTYMKTLLSGVDRTIFSEKMQVGTNFASEIVATILIGLHMSETCSRFSSNKETEKHVVNPITCGDCICPTHNLLGIKYNAQMSCEFGGEYLYTTLLYKLNAASPRTTKIKSFAELPVLLDEQFCEDNICKDCGSPLNNDLLLSNTPHFLTIVLNWLGGSESQDTLSEVLASITSPLDTGFFCKRTKSSAMYTLTSMVFMRDFVSSALAFLMKGEPQIVNNFLLETACLESRNKMVDVSFLPEAVIGAIAARLVPSRSSIEAMRAVNRHWRSSLPPTRGPWLVLSPTNIADTIFLGISHGALVRQRPMFLPSAFDYCWNCSSGLMALDAGYTHCVNCGREDPIPPLPENLRLTNLSFLPNLICATCEDDHLIRWAAYDDDQWFDFDYAIAIAPKSVAMVAGVAFIAAAPSSVIVDTLFEERLLPLDDLLDEAHYEAEIPHHHPAPIIIDYLLDVDPEMAPWVARGHHVFTVGARVYLCNLLRHSQDMHIELRLFMVQPNPDPNGEAALILPADDIGDYAVLIGASQAFVVPANAQIMANTAYVVMDDGVERETRVVAVNLHTGLQTSLHYPEGLGAAHLFMPGSWLYPLPEQQDIAWHCA